METALSPTVAPASESRRIARPRPFPIAVEVLACGRPEFGDERLGAIVARTLRRRSTDIRVRDVRRLGIDDLLSVARGAVIVVVDVADGLRGGRILRLPLEGLIERAGELRPRGSSALGFREVLGVAGLIRGHPLRGEIVLVGGVHFEAGGELSPSVRRAVPKAVRLVEAACTALRDAPRGP